MDLHVDGQRQGPGSVSTTLQALNLARPHLHAPSGEGLAVADIGCGTGASTLVLARALDAHITAVDFFPAFLERLVRRAEAAGLGERVSTLQADMAALPFQKAAIDLMWSEGAIYSMGFQEGIRAWRRYLKPGGILAVSEITWTTEQRPAQIETYWQAEYPQIATAEAKVQQLREAGYAPVGHFLLPERCWTAEYYTPLQLRHGAFLNRHGHAEAAQQLIETEREEVARYTRFKDYFSYGFYVARKA